MKEVKVNSVRYYYEQERKKHFAKYGWKCVVFFDDAWGLNENDVLRCIK